MIKIFYSLFIMYIFSHGAIAGEVDGVPKDVSPYKDLLFFSIEEPKRNNPACATRTDRWVFKADTAEGKTFAASLLMAFTLGRTISVVGKNACGLGGWTDVETVDYFTVH